jgi:hypothetical protein
MAFANRFPGTCSTCAKPVAASAGLTERVAGAWRVWHTACVPQVVAAPVAPPAPIVRVKLAPEGVEVEAVGRLGGLFGDYKLAQDGAGLRWHRADGRVTGTLRQGAAFLAAVSQISGLTLDVRPDARAAIEGVLDAERAEVEAANQRAAGVDAMLAARGAVQGGCPMSQLGSRRPRSEVLAAAAKIRTREDLMPTSGPSEPHVIVDEVEVGRRCLTFIPGQLIVSRFRPIVDECVMSSANLQEGVDPCEVAND